MSPSTLVLGAPPDLQLRSLHASNAAVLLEAVNTDRAHFETWLRWAQSVRTLDDAARFIARAAELEAAEQGFHLGIWQGEQLVGGVPCWSIDPIHRVAELGYWLHGGVRGNGIASAATSAVMAYLFDHRRVNRIEFQCRVENEASRRTAERLGGRLEGIRRESHWVGGAFRDHAVYAILATDRYGSTTSTEPTHGRDLR